MSPHRPAFIPKENHRACQEHGASNQGDQPGLLKLSDEARLVVLVEPCHSAVLKETIDRTYVGNFLFTLHQIDLARQDTLFYTLL